MNDQDKLTENEEIAFAMGMVSLSHYLETAGMPGEIAKRLSSMALARYINDYRNMPVEDLAVIWNESEAILEAALELFETRRKARQQHYDKHAN